jgi:hypothetical protein
MLSLTRLFPTRLLNINDKTRIYNNANKLIVTKLNINDKTRIYNNTNKLIVTKKQIKDLHLRIKNEPITSVY